MPWAPDFSNSVWGVGGVCRDHSNVVITKCTVLLYMSDGVKSIPMIFFLLCSKTIKCVC